MNRKITPALVIFLLLLSTALSACCESRSDDLSIELGEVVQELAEEKRRENIALYKELQRTHPDASFEDFLEACRAQRPSSLCPPRFHGLIDDQEDTPDIYRGIAKLNAREEWNEAKASR